MLSTSLLVSASLMLSIVAMSANAEARTAPSPLPTIGSARVRTSECSALAAATTKAVDRIRENDAQAAALQKTLTDTDYDALPPIRQRNARIALYRFGRELQETAAQADAAMKTLDDVAETSLDGSRRHGVRFLLDALRTVNDAHREMGVDLVRALVVQEGRTGLRGIENQTGTNASSATIAPRSTPAPDADPHVGDGSFTALARIAPKSYRDRSDPDMNLLLDDLSSDFGDRDGQIAKVERAVPPRIALAESGC